MKNIGRIFVLLLLVLVPSYAFAGLGDVGVSLIEGDVQVRPADTQDWVPASINLPLREGDSLWVPPGGRAELQLRDGAVVRLDQNSALDILRQEDGSSQFYLAEGSSYVNFRRFGNGFLQLDTPVSSIRVYEDARFGVDVTQAGDTDVSAFQGTVIVESSKGRTSVTAGSALSMGDNYADFVPPPLNDEWLAWNRDRDRRFATRGYSSRYLPESLDPYAYDLDHYGRWVSTSEYGYVWTPTVGISVGWAPYRDGRWIWVGGDYVWVSYDPWGWVPFHYGRWSHVASIGWCWVPPARDAAYWGPGYVGWVHTSSDIAWVPLAPGETYYGYGYYGPHSVNITNVNIQTARTKIVYRNINFNNAVTVVNRKSFTSSRPVMVHPAKNPFLQANAALGRPLVRPQRAAYIPISKEIPKAKLPPRSVREVRVKQLRQERPLVKEQGRSVMNPHAPERKMPVRTLQERRAPVNRETQKKEVAPSRQAQPGVKPMQTAPQRQFQRPSEESRRPVTTPSVRPQENRRQQSPSLRSAPQPPERTRPNQPPAAKQPAVRRPETPQQRSVQPSVVPPERTQRNQSPAVRQPEVRRPETPRQRSVQPPPVPSPRIETGPSRSPVPAAPPAMERRPSAPSVRPTPRIQQPPVASPERYRGQGQRDNGNASPNVRRAPTVEKKEKVQDQNTPVGEIPAEQRGGRR